MSVRVRHDSAGVSALSYCTGESSPGGRAPAPRATVTLREIQEAARLYLPATITDLRQRLPHKFQDVTTIQEALICLAWLDSVCCPDCGSETWDCTCTCPVCGSTSGDYPANDCPECGRVSRGSLALMGH